MIEKVMNRPFKRAPTSMMAQLERWAARANNREPTVPNNPDATRAAGLARMWRTHTPAGRHKALKSTTKPKVTQVASSGIGPHTPKGAKKELA